MNPPCHVAAARPRCDGGATRSSSDSAATVNMALPTPPAARRTRNSGKDDARPARPVVTATTTRPVDRTVRSPNRSTSEPPPKAETKRKNAKALTASPTAVVPTPKDRANSGIAGATMPKPSATTKATTARIPTSRGSSDRPRHSTPWMLARRRPRPSRTRDSAGREPVSAGGRPRSAEESTHRRSPF
jgi:hypothetical protein